jgi:hypothetical protein
MQEKKQSHAGTAISLHARQATRQDNSLSSVVKQHIKITIKILNLHSLSYFGSKARRVATSSSIKQEINIKKSIMMIRSPSD